MSVHLVVGVHRERLYQADPRAVEMDVKGVTIPIADTPINCGPPSLVET